MNMHNDVNSVNKWDIHFAKVPFEEEDGRYSIRPVLVYEKRQAFLLTFKMTGTGPRPGYSGEYRVSKWSEAGLSKETTVRLSKPFVFKEEDLLRRVGSLHPTDRVEITRIVDRMYPRLQQSRVASQDPVQKALERERRVGEITPEQEKEIMRKAARRSGFDEPPSHGLSR